MNYRSHAFGVQRICMKCTEGPGQASTGISVRSLAGPSLRRVGVEPRSNSSSVRTHGQSRPFACHHSSKPVLVQPGIPMSLSRVSSGNRISRRNWPTRVLSTPSLSSSSAWECPFLAGPSLRRVGIGTRSSPSSVRTHRQSRPFAHHHSTNLVLIQVGHSPELGLGLCRQPGQHQALPNPCPRRANVL
jgi:hypothetical protein